MRFRSSPYQHKISWGMVISNNSTSGSTLAVTSQFPAAQPKKMASGDCGKERPVTSPIWLTVVLAPKSIPGDQASEYPVPKHWGRRPDLASLWPLSWHRAGAPTDPSSFLSVLQTLKSRSCFLSEGYSLSAAEPMPVKRSHMSQSLSGWKPMTFYSTVELLWTVGTGTTMQLGGHASSFHFSSGKMSRSHPRQPAVEGSGKKNAAGETSTACRW